MYAICRSYNNPKIVGLLESLRSLPEINGLIVPVNSDRDGAPSGTSGFSTRAYLQETSGFENLKCLPIPDQDYGWSKALNVALAHVPPRETYVLIISTEIRLTSVQFTGMCAAAAPPSASCGYVLFQDREETCFQFPRNTCLVWKLSLLKSIVKNGIIFDELLDSRSGMEDVELALRLMEQSDVVPMLGARDVRLEARTTASEFARKVAAENQAIEEIFERFPAETVERFRHHIRAENQKRLM
ncbi:hypothetical protein AB1L42_18470 [Thalassoglobus sp. JC818]|uniref:hypothetical protein n=1 Tax=Thalassoglobus sp. JC818 TaxID=3232136 RepID=UPI003457B373